MKRNILMVICWIMVMMIGVVNADDDVNGDDDANDDDDHI